MGGADLAAALHRSTLTISLNRSDMGARTVCDISQCPPMQCAAAGPRSVGTNHARSPALIRTSTQSLYASEALSATITACAVRVLLRRVPAALSPHQVSISMQICSEQEGHIARTIKTSNCVANLPRTSEQARTPTDTAECAACGKLRDPAGQNA